MEVRLRARLTRRGRARRAGPPAEPGDARRAAGLRERRTTRVEPPGSRPSPPSRVEPRGSRPSPPSRLETLRRTLLAALALLTIACGSRTGLRAPASEPSDERDAGALDALAPDAGVADGGCRADADCADGLACTTNRCVAGRCEATPDDARCDDGVFCNGRERCDLRRGCVAGDAPGCADGVACTVDACDPALDACVSTPDDRRCSGSERCDALRGCVTRAIAVWEGRVMDVDLPSGDGRVRFTSPGPWFTDVALHPDGTLYGLTPDEVVALDPVTRGRTRVAALTGLGARFDGLDVAPDGALYASGGRLVVRVDPRTGLVERALELPAGWVSAGDLSFFGGRAFIAIAPGPGRGEISSLAELELASGATRVLGSIGFSCVWGLAEVDGALYGLTCNGFVVALDLLSGAGREVARVRGTQFWGASSRQ